MRKKWLRTFAGIILAGLAIYLVLVLFPRSYDVPPMQSRKDIRYWQLSTGSRIAYTFIPAKGKKKPFPVIFLQGGPGGFISERNIQMLAPLADDGYDVYLYDQTGSGLSDRLDDIREYTVQRHLADLKAIIKETGAPKVILLGQSWGTALATFFVAENARKVDRLIFTGPGPVFPINRELDGIQPPDSLHVQAPVYTNAQANHAAKNLRSEWTDRCARWFGWKLASDEEADHFMTVLNQHMNKAVVCDTSKALEALAGGGYYAHIMTVKSLYKAEDPRTLLRNIQVPLLIMKGQCDNQKWGYVMEYHRLFTNCRLVIIPGAGHSISVEQPQLYLQTIRDFLNTP